MTVPLRTLAVLVLALSLWCGWRWVELGRAVAANRRALAGALRARPGDPAHDPSARVAHVVERDERLFDDTLVLAATRHSAGVLAVACAVVGLLAAGASARRRTAHVDVAAR